MLHTFILTVLIYFSVAVAHYALYRDLGAYPRNLDCILNYGGSLPKTVREMSFSFTDAEGRSPSSSRVTGGVTCMPELTGKPLWFPVECRTEEAVNSSLNFLRREATSIICLDNSFIIKDYLKYMERYCDDLNKIVFPDSLKTFSTKGYSMRIWAACNVVRSTCWLRLTLMSTKDVRRCFSAMISWIDVDIMRFGSFWI